MIMKHKKDGDEAYYTKQYHSLILSKLDPQKVYDDLKDSVLLCYEKPGDFCHRRLVAAWIETALNEPVEEYGSITSKT
jgi:hypothetical protein